MATLREGTNLSIVYRSAVIVASVLVAGVVFLRYRNSTIGNQQFVIPRCRTLHMDRDFPYSATEREACRSLPLR